MESRRALFWMLIVLTVATTVPGCSRPREGEFERIKTRVDAHRLQSWATEVLKQYPEGIADDPARILSNSPAVLKDLQMGREGPLIDVSAAGPDSNRCVSLLYADSFGFGGNGHCVYAGGMAFQMATNAECVEWIPGVYYQYVHSP